MGCVLCNARPVVVCVLTLYNTRGVVIYCESGFQFKCFVRHVQINRFRCYNNNNNSSSEDGGNTEEKLTRKGRV